MSQRYNGNTERPKLKENQSAILKIYAFCQKNQQMVSGPGWSCWGYVSIYENTAKKLLHLFPLKFATTLLIGSRKGPFGA